MSTVNEVRLIGNLGGDVIVKRAESGRAMGYFSLAVSSYYTNQAGERIEKTDWVKVSAYGKNLEAIEKELIKGVRVCVLGELRNNSYIDKEGRSVNTVDVVASYIWKV
jgi:single-strand DNA-binding protein